MLGKLIVWGFMLAMVGVLVYAVISEVRATR